MRILELSALWTEHETKIVNLLLSYFSSIQEV